eukprot:6325201-Amphidinium_carterae.1
MAQAVIVMILTANVVALLITRILVKRSGLQCQATGKLSKTILRAELLAVVRSLEECAKDCERLQRCYLCGQRLQNTS